MEQNIELMIHSDSKENLNTNFEEQHSNNNFETESEKKNRISIQNALSSNNSKHAFQKITNNITSFCSKITKLQDYCLNLESRYSIREKVEDINELIIKTADEISETFDMIEIIINFEYKDKNQKIQNITKANNLKDDCCKYKNKFEDLTEKIKKSNLNAINQANRSVRNSNYSQFSGDIQLDNEEPSNNFGFQNGKEFLEEIEIKKKQNDAINQANLKIGRVSKISNLNRENSLNNNHMEYFNFGYKKNKNNNGVEKNLNEREDSKFHNMNSTVFREMEDKVLIALEDHKECCLTKHWLLSLIITICIIIIILYYIFEVR